MLMVGEFWLGAPLVAVAAVAVFDRLALKSLVTRFVATMLVTGAPGVGKTLAARWLVRLLT